MTISFRRQQGSRVYHFRSLADLLAKATPERSGDVLAGIGAESATERVVAQMTLADLPLATFQGSCDPLRERRNHSLDHR